MKKIIIILLLILSPMFVNADDVNVKIDYVDNVYWNYYRNNTLYSGKFAYIHVNDKIAYGINIRKELGSGPYVEERWEFTDAFIIKIAYFGYGYNNEYTLKDYMATQKIIWGYTNSEEVYFTTEINGGGSLISIDEQVDKIYKRYNNQAKFPNYGNDGKYLLGTTNIKSPKESVSIPLNIINTTNNDITIDENGNIIFNAKEIGSNTFSLQTNYEKKYPNKEYISSEYQNLVTIGTNSVSTKKYYYEVIAGSININLKYDNLIKAKITNNTFELYISKNELVGIYSSNEEGNITINNLYKDKYTLKPKEIIEGYKIDNNEYIFEINESNLNINKEINLKQKTSKISISKTYGNIILNDINYESNQIYKIYDEKENVINEVKTNEKGYVEFNLNYGNYKIIEDDLKRNNEYIEINKTMFERDNHFDIHTYEYKTNIKIITKYKNNNEKIGNVSFYINDDKYTTNEEGISIIKNSNFDTYNFNKINVNGFKTIDSYTYEINENSNFYIENNVPYVDIVLFLEEKIEEESKDKEDNVIDNEEIKKDDVLIENTSKKEEDIIVEIENNNEKKEVENINNKDEENINKEEIINEENIEKLPFLGDNNINEENKIIYYVFSFIKFNWLQYI